MKTIAKVQNLYISEYQVHGKQFFAVTKGSLQPDKHLYSLIETFSEAVQKACMYQNIIEFIN